MLLVADVSKVNIHKVTGPDGLSGCVLNACTHLASVITIIFNLSLPESVIPTCFKQTTIVPVPKEAMVTCLNDRSAIALMLVAMKCFERLVMAHINSILPDILDPLQFAFHPNRSTMQSQSLSILPFPTWTKGTPM